MSKVVGNFGRLWGKGHEKLARRILSVNGPGATKYLQGLITSDLLSPPVPPRPEKSQQQPGLPKKLQERELPTVEFGEQLRATCFLDTKGRVLTDSLLWKVDDQQYFIDCPEDCADTLYDHLLQYKLRRSKVSVEHQPEMSSYVVYGTLNAAGAPDGFLSGLDPRHPSLGLRILQLPNTAPDTFASIMANSPFPDATGNYELVRRLAGVGEGSELQGKVALECNQEFLNAVSFHKGCYLGQELTARVQHTGVLRKRILPLLLLDTVTQVPQAWSLASSLQTGRQERKFTKNELSKLPSSRLPRLSVLTAGNLTAITTGSIEPEGNAVDQAAALELQRAQEKAAALLEEIEHSCQTGAKIVRQDDGTTIGQILSPPVKGTNVVLAMMRLESVGLLKGGTWSKTNKVRIGDDSENDLRYLPYLPLWWPKLNHQTGKGMDEEEEEDYEDEAREDDGSGLGIKMPRIEIEHVPLEEEEAKKTS